MNEIKWFIQRGKRGYADCDLWGVDEYLSEIIPPMVRSLKKGSGCPSEFYDPKAINNECHRWHGVLEEIAQGFEASRFLSTHSYQKFVKDGKYHKLEIDTKAIENAKKKMEKGLSLFAKHFISLWD